MSIIDMSLVKAPRGNGPPGPATIDGWPFRIDPTSVELPIRAKVAKFRTVGGFVVQVYGTTWGDLTVSGQFGVTGWPAQVNFLNRMVGIGRDQAMQHKPVQAGQNYSPGRTFRFTYPLLGWDFPECYLKGYTSSDGPMAVHMENTNINPKYTLTIFIITDTSTLAHQTKQAYLQRLAPGLGMMWDSKTESYQGYAQDQYNSPLANTDLQNYVNSPAGGGSSDVVSAVPSNFTGPTTDNPPGGGSGAAPDPGNIKNPSDFAKALLTALKITPTTTNINLCRAWQYQEGMWSQSLLNDGGYPGNWTTWGAPYMNNPLNIGGWNGQGANGTKGTYGPGNWPVTWLNNGSTGVTFSFGGSWANGVAATAYALENENSNWPAIVDALRKGDEAAFFAAVHYWNAGQVNPTYEARVQTKYDDPQGMANAGY